MARFKKPLSIYIKESWLKDIQFFAEKQEESVSEYIERAVSFQLLHDRKAWEKEKAKKAEKEKALSVEALIDMSEDDWKKFLDITAKAAATRHNIEIAQTKVYKDN